MTRNFTRTELFQIRNEIKIDFVIKSLLDIPVKEHEGIVRFLCPRCGEFQTGMNPNTNLARCFLCEENFNPIDLVMAQRKIGFVEAVRFLKQVLTGKPCPTREHSQANNPPAYPRANPLSTGDILAAVYMEVKQRNTVR